MIIDTQSRLTCTEPCLSAGVRLPSVAPGLGTSGHAATPPLAFVCGCVCVEVGVCVSNNHNILLVAFIFRIKIRMSSTRVTILFQCFNQSVNQQSKPTFM